MKKETILTTITPSRKPKIVDTKRPEKTFFHSSILIPDMLLLIATAAPESDATRAWLSLVGIPKNQAATAHRIIEISAAFIAIVAVFVSLPKSEILAIDETTFPLKCDIINTPRKFITAARRIAFLGVIVFDDMQVAIAVGASVQPLTIITPEISMYDNKVAGFCVITLIVSVRCKYYQSSRMSAIILPDATS